MRKTRAINPAKRLQTATSTIGYRRLQTATSTIELTPSLRSVQLCSHPKLIVAAEPAAEPTKFVQASAFVEESPPAPNAVAADKIKSDSDSGKIEVVEELLRNIRGATDEKCVVVSNYTNALNVVQEIAKKRKWGFVRLDGTTPVNSRQGIVDTFNRTPADSKFLFLLSSKAGGEWAKRASLQEDEKLYTSHY